MLVHVVREMRDVLVDARRAGLDPWVTVGGILTSTVEDRSHKAAIVAALMLAVMELSGDEDAATDELDACSDVVKFLKSRDRWY
jgi:thiamine monophosphate synthase